MLVFKACVSSLICLLLLLTVPVRSDSSGAGPSHEVGNPLFIKELPAKPQRGSAPFGWTPEILRKLFPEPVNPRLPSLQDIGTEVDQYHFINGGFTFTIAGDFNKDGVPDNAFVGKYDQPGTAEPHYFLVIVSMKKPYVTVRYFRKLGAQRVVLLRIERYHRNFDAILAVQQFEADNCSYIFWNGRVYESRSCD